MTVRTSIDEKTSSSSIPRIKVSGKLFLQIIYDHPSGISFGELHGPYPSREAAQSAADFINNQDRKQLGLLPAFATIRFEAFSP